MHLCYVQVGENNVAGGGEKFIFKVLNSMDSMKTGHIEAEHEAMTLLSTSVYHACTTVQLNSMLENYVTNSGFFLEKNGVNCPMHQKTLQGKIFARVNLPKSLSADANNRMFTALKMYWQFLLVCC